MEEHGVCPVSFKIETLVEDSGNLEGYFCWGLAGTLCDREVGGKFSARIMNCVECE